MQIATDDITTTQGVDSLSPLDLVQRFATAFPGKLGPITLGRIAQEATKYPCPMMGPFGRQMMRVDMYVVLYYLNDVGGVSAEKLSSLIGYSQCWTSTAVRLGRDRVKAREAKLLRDRQSRRRLGRGGA